MSLGRMKTGWPRASLLIEAGRVRMDICPVGWVAESLEWGPDQGMLVFPCRGWLGRSGVGFFVEGRNFYFWTGKGAHVLAACRQQGFTVSEEVARVRYDD